MEITFLGTTCMVPTKDRNHSAVFLKYEGDGILIDCGEGTQRQLKIAGIKITEVTKILISHWHGDHVLGIPGLIQSLGASEYSGQLEIYGPSGTMNFMENMLKAFVFDNKVDFVVKEIEKDGILIDSKKYQIEAYLLDHGITTYGFRFVEKDRRKIDVIAVQKLGIPEGPLLGKLQSGEDVIFNGLPIRSKDATYIIPGNILGVISDTQICEGCYTIAQDADLLISEAAYETKLEDKAIKYKHMTGRQAGQVASASNVKKLILTHFSARYKTSSEIEEDAKEVFSDIVCAYDMMRVKLSNNDCK